MAKLKVLIAYRSRSVVYEAGSVLEVPDEEAAFLLRDAPGAFEVVEGKALTAALDGPPGDKMVRKPQAKK